MKKFKKIVCLIVQLKWRKLFDKLKINHKLTSNIKDNILKKK